MSLEVAGLTFDCANPHALAEFWQKVAGGEIEDHGDFVFLMGPAVGVPALAFGRVPEGKTVKNRCHIDFHAQNRDEEVARLEKLGATALGKHEVHDQQWTVMADPEHNEFCIAQA